jgi:hypothetical protein
MARPSLLVLRTYQTGDEWRITARPDFAAEFAAAGEVIPYGPKWTIQRGGDVVAIGGLEPLGDRQWSLWAYAAELAPREWAAALHWTRGLLAHEVAVLDMGSVRAVAGSHPGAGLVLRHLNFRPEGDPNIFQLEI